MLNFFTKIKQAINYALGRKRIKQVSPGKFMLTFKVSRKVQK